MLFFPTSCCGHRSVFRSRVAAATCSYKMLVLRNSSLWCMARAGNPWFSSWADKSRDEQLLAEDAVSLPLCNINTWWIQLLCHLHAPSKIRVPLPSSKPLWETVSALKIFQSKQTWQSAGEGGNRGLEREHRQPGCLWQQQENLFPFHPDAKKRKSFLLAFFFSFFFFKMLLWY